MEKKRRINLLKSLAFTAVSALAITIASIAGTSISQADTSEYTDSGRSSVTKLSINEIRSTYNNIPQYSTLYATEPGITESDVHISTLTDEAYQSALAYINYYRTVAGLAPVTFDENASTYSSYGALVLAINNQLTHYPTKPDIMSQNDYDIASATTRSSNLSMLCSSSPNIQTAVLSSAIGGQMSDSSNNNVSTLGHRRWLLHPNTQTMGIGTANNGNYYYTDVKVFSNYITTIEATDYNYISWPSSGYNLTETFSYLDPWSITLNPSVYDTPYKQNVSVTLTRIADGKTWTFDSSTSNTNGTYYAVNTQGYGIRNCIIFRPLSIDVSNGYVGEYSVSVKGLELIDGTETTLNYSVYFAPLNGDISSDQNYSSTLPQDEYRYQNKEICPEPIVKHRGTALVKDKDYTVEYQDNNAIGTGKVIIKGIGAYSGEITKEFSILGDVKFITYYDNDGTNTKLTVNADTGSTVTLQTRTSSDIRLVLAGWATSPTATAAEYAPNAAYTLTEDIDLYAVWVDIPHITTAQLDVTITTPKQIVYYYFTAVEDSFYGFYTLGSDDTYGYLYDSNLNLIEENDNGDVTTRNFYIGHYLEAGKTYILGVKFDYSTKTGTIDLHITGGKLPTEYKDGYDIAKADTDYVNMTLSSNLMLSYVLTPVDDISVTKAYVSHNNGDYTEALLTASADGKITATIDLSSVQLTDSLSIKFAFTANSNSYTSKVYTCSAEGYILALLNKNTAYFGTAANETKTKQLAANVLVYGAYSQIYFNVNTDRLANRKLAELGYTASVTLPDTSNITRGSITSVNDNSTVSAIGNSLLLESVLKLRTYFVPTASGELGKIYVACTVNGVNKTVNTTVKDGLIYADIPLTLGGIANECTYYAYAIIDGNIVVVSDKYSYNVPAYYCDIATYSQDSDLINLVAALLNM